MLLIGSRATRFHFPEARKPKDYDFMATTVEVDQFLSKFSYKDTTHHPKKRRAQIDLNGHGHKVSFEFELIEHYPSSQIITKYDKSYSKDDKELGIKYFVASPQTLFLLKRSHVVYNIHWDKNILDYLFLRNKITTLSYPLPLWWEKAYNLRFEEVKNRVAKKEMNFDVDNSEFFKKSEKFVNRKVEHDSLHYATCFLDKPIFMTVKDDLSKAALSETKVAQLSPDLKIMMIQEEAMALSLERYIIPSLLESKPFDAKLAYIKTAKKMVYHYLPIFLRHFAADHFLEIVDLKIDYVNKFLNNHPTIKSMVPGERV